MEARNRLALAADNMPPEKLGPMLSELRGMVGWVKINYNLVLRMGVRAAADFVRKQGMSTTFTPKVFLDLKFHDIPATVANAVEVAIEEAASAGVELLNMHISAGPVAVEDAAKVIERTGRKTRLLGVTVLTSLGWDHLAELGFVPNMNLPDAEKTEHIARMVYRLANVGIDSRRDHNLDGFICSPLETAELRRRHPDSLLVVPGIRPAGADANDQTRIATPASAIEAGADILVVGRAITDPKSGSRAEACERILNEMEAELRP